MTDKEEAPGEKTALQSELNKLFVHDLKNPISALSANLSFLETALTDESEDVRGAVGDSMLAVQMLLRFSENLHLIARLEADEAVELTPIPLDTFVLAGIRRNEDFAASAGVHLKVTGSVPARSANWPVRYAELILDNMILSAVRHSPPGGSVRIEAGFERGDSEAVFLEVADRGRPVAGECKTGLLSREGQSMAKSRSDTRYGRGLGLYAAGLAMEAMGGRLDIKERADEVLFCVHLPMDCDPDD